MIKESPFLLTATQRLLGLDYLTQKQTYTMSFQDMSSPNITRPYRLIKREMWPLPYLSFKEGWPPAPMPFLVH